MKYGLLILFIVNSPFLLAQSYLNCAQQYEMYQDAGAKATSIKFQNDDETTISIYWIKPNGEHVQYATLKPSSSYVQQTYTTHLWVAKSLTGTCLGVYKNGSPTLVTIHITASQDDGQVMEENPVVHPKHEEGAIKPPFWGTIFVDKNIITDSDPNTYSNIRAIGQGKRTMFDRREEKFIERNAFLFEATYTDGLTVEVQVNPEFGSATMALPYAKKYARAIGFLPTELRKDVQTMWIHKGNKLFGGGNNNILIHTEQALAYEKDGILEETLVHEASHTSLDAYHAKAIKWKDAQKADGNYISTYAKDNPEREDVAESYLLYLALRYKSDRISAELKSTIMNTIPNRIKYFDQQNFKMFPILRN